MAQPIQKINRTQDIQRGREAEGLLSHPMIEGAFVAIEQKHISRWIRSEVDDVKGREHSFRQIRAAQEFRILLTKYVEDGKLASAEVVQEERQKSLTED